MVRIKALQARCEAKEEVVCCQHTRLEYKANQRNQYKEASCILNVKLMVKTDELEKATQRCKERTKANTNLTMELAAFREQVEQAKVDVVVEYQISQPFLGELGGLYGDGFKDYLM